MGKKGKKGVLNPASSSQAPEQMPSHSGSDPSQIGNPQQGTEHSQVRPPYEPTGVQREPHPLPRGPPKHARFPSPGGPPPGHARFPSPGGPPPGHARFPSPGGPPPGHARFPSPGGPPPGHVRFPFPEGPPPGFKEIFSGQWGPPLGFKGVPSGQWGPPRKFEEVLSGQWGPPRKFEEVPSGQWGPPRKFEEVPSGQWGPPPAKITGYPKEASPVQKLQEVATSLESTQAHPVKKRAGKGRGKPQDKKAPSDLQTGEPGAPPEQLVQEVVAAPDSAQGDAAHKSQKRKGKDRDTRTTTQTPNEPQAGPAQDKPGKSESDRKAAEDTSKVPSVTTSLQELTLSNYTIPKRNGVITHGPKTCMSRIRIEVNYLPITIKTWNLKIYHYDVSFNPDKPKGLLRTALLQFREKHYKNRHPAFDGQKNLYAAGKPLPFRGNTVRDSVKVFDVENDREKEFDITIKLVSDDLNLMDLKKYMENGKSQNMPQTVIQATDIAFRADLYKHFIPCGRSFFSDPANCSLGGGLELYNGFFQSAIMGQQKAFLNVDVANKAFPEEQSVIDYLRNILNVADNDLRAGLTDHTKRDLHNYIKGLKVIYSPQERERRTYRVNGVGVEPMQHIFEIEGKGKMNVADYFRKEKKISLRYPKLPLLHVGPPQRETMVPLEFCRIIGRQVIMRKLDERQTSSMVRAAATSTDIRKNRIMYNIQNAHYGRSETLAEFGITVNTNFTKVDSVVFKPPTIQYRGENRASVRNGVWKMDRHQFRDSANGLQRWAVLIKDSRTSEREIRDGLVRHLKNCGQQMGLQVADPARILEASRPNEQKEEHILRNLKTLNEQYGPLQIVVVIMPAFRPDAYSNIKRASELQCGVLTQCLKQITATRKMNPMTAQNILLKMNAKVNGVNHELADGDSKPAVLREKVMFVGADVTHPAPGSESTPSIAAVAASFDKAGFRYKMMYYLQGSRKEMIEGLEEIMIEQLKHYQKQNNALPDPILYYRDGVSEGQFSAVLNIELQALKKACVKVARDYKPRITFLVVQKRHHTRFFPDRRDGDGSKNNNVLAGTVVDTDITHPTEMDFYLVSHQSIQGTARPTKYHVLWDEYCFNGEDMEILTYYLCYLFSRCNRSVSYPAPTYYAHLGAFRARAYWDGQRIEMSKLREEQAKRGTIQPNIVNNAPMFFV